MNEVLEAMYRDRVVYQADGTPTPFHSGIKQIQAELLTRICRERNARSAIDVGLAYGASAFAILHGVGAGGRLVAIDPHQSTDWNGIGVLNARRAGFDDALELIEKPDGLALPLLAERGEQVQLAVIDGWHTFDSVFIDCYYLDQLLEVRGAMTFHGYAMPGIKRAVTALMAHRSYQVVPEYEARRAWRNRIGAFGKRLKLGTLRPSNFSLAPAARANMAVFE